MSIVALSASITGRSSVAVPGLFRRLSDRLFHRGRVAATPMNGWGPSGDDYLRLVFANEPVDRLADLRGRFEAALA